MDGSPLDSWIGKRVSVVITETKITHGWLRENHIEGILIELDDGRQEFIPKFLRVELPAETRGGEKI